MSDKPHKKITSEKDATKRRKSTASATSSQKSFKGKTKTTPAKKEDTPTTPTGSATESGPPDDIFPLVLTSKTQELFQCRADEDLTQDNLHKIIKKEEILNDMKMRAAVSDFYPVKQMVMNYPGEELLLVFDRDFKYGQSFYLVGTEDTKERILHPPEPSEEEGVEEEDLMETFVYKTPEPKPWESLGSDLDIEEESVKDSRCKHRNKISRKRREFGAPVMFTDRNASVARDGYIECTSYPDKSFCVTKMEMDTGIQAVPQLQETSTQTKWKYPRNACTQYVPREFTDEEKENFMNSQSLKDFINSVALRFEIAVQQNEIMDAFFDDWKALREDESTFGGKTDTHLKEYQSFTDLYYSKDKAVGCINWHPTIYGIIAVAVSERLSFEDRINLSAKLVMTPSLILIWSFSDPIHPQLLMECPDDICCFEFCPSDPDIIVGGCINGQVVLWDISAYAERLQSTRTGGAKHTPAAVNALPGFEDKNVKKTPIVRYCAVSSIEHGHKAPISDVQWLPDYYEISRQGIPLENKNGICVQIISCAPDCSVYFWDIRPPNTATQAMTDRKKSEEKHLQNPQGIPNTFKHLDLTWKPLIRVGLPRIETSGEYSALKVSLKDIFQEGRLHGITDKSGAAKLEKPDGGFDYRMLRVPSAKNLKTQEDISTTFFVGTEDGDLVYSDFKMEKDSDSGKLTSSKPSHCFVIHDGLVTTVKRSPFFKDIVLTVGGWTFAIWKEGVMNGPILQSSASQKKCTVGHWSLSRPGVFFIGKEDGNIDIWDLLEKTHEPSQTQNISTGQITCIKPWIVSSKQHLLAVSDEFGTLHILEIPWTLRHPSSNEKLSVTNYFEREVKHLNYSEKRREFREQEKRDMDAEEQRRLSEIVHEKTAEQLEEEVQQEFREYLKLEKHILSDMGLIKPAEDTPLPGV